MCSEKKKRKLTLAIEFSFPYEFSCHMEAEKDRNEECLDSCW